MADALALAPPDDGEDVAGRAIEVVTLPCGPAVKVRTSQLGRMLESQSRRRVAVTQFFVPVPVPRSPWFAVLTGTTPSLDLADDLDERTSRSAVSLLFTDAAGTPLPTLPVEDESPVRRVGGAGASQEPAGAVRS